MNLLQGALALAVVVTLVGADGLELGSLVNWNPFALLYGSEEAGEGNPASTGVATEGDVENMCTVLYNLMGHLATNNTFECQPLPSPVEGNIDEFCNFCAVDTVGYCKGQMNVPACLEDSLKVSTVYSKKKYCTVTTELKAIWNYPSTMHIASQSKDPRLDF